MLYLGIQFKEKHIIQKNIKNDEIKYYNCYLQLLSEKGSVDFFGRKPDIPIIQLSDKKIVISTNWPTIVNGKPAEFSKFLELLKTKLKYVVENR